MYSTIQHGIVLPSGNTHSCEHMQHSITMCCIRSQYARRMCAHMRPMRRNEKKFVVVLVRHGDVEHREDHEQSFNVVEARRDVELERDILQLNAKKRRRKVICNTCAEARDTGNNKTSDFTSKYAIITANQARGSGARADTSGAETDKRRRIKRQQHGRTVSCFQ